MRTQFSLSEIEALTGIPARQIMHWKSRRWFQPSQPRHGWYWLRDVLHLVCLDTLRAHGLSVPHAQACISDGLLAFFHGIEAADQPVGPNVLSGIQSLRLLVHQERQPAPQFGIDLFAEFAMGAEAAFEKVKAAKERVVLVAAIGEPLAETLQRVAALDAGQPTEAEKPLPPPAAKPLYWKSIHATGRSDG